MVTRLGTFSRALRQLRISTWSFEWFTWLSESFVTGYSDYFGFGFTLLNWKPLLMVIITQKNAISICGFETGFCLFCLVFFCLCSRFKPIGFVTQRKWIAWWKRHSDWTSSGHYRSYLEPSTVMERVSQTLYWESRSCWREIKLVPMGVLHSNRLMEMFRWMSRIFRTGMTIMGLHLQ